MFANKEEPHPRPLYSLTPVPSPNGEGSENHCLLIKKQPHPQPLSEWRGE